MYKPNPLDTSGVQLDKDLLELTEKIAENVHEVWAAGRINDGWKYGDERNDALKETPCLVPYNELPEEEKEYDRKTAMETIKFIVKSGYMMIKKNLNKLEATMKNGCSYFKNKDCEYFPCHYGAGDIFNCLFCYCPLYSQGKDCGGNFSYTQNGIKDCSRCLIPHSKDGYAYIMSKLAGKER